VQPPVVTTQPVKQPVVDTAVAKPIVDVPKPSSYNFKADVPHYVVLVLNKVDGVFVNEAKNAFARYNRDTYYNKPMNAELSTLDADNRLLLISPFKTAQEAIDYIDKTKPKTATEIIPWLKGGKYSYSIIDASNLELLKTKKSIEEYNQFMNQHFPGKF
jgi:hypothetical protein